MDVPGVWMGSPPEVHSALLSAGAGPGPLLASAGAWSALGAQYEAVTDELVAVLGAVQAGVWQGPSAQAYVAAHVPYLAWLNQAGADSAAAAARCDTAAAAYTVALAAMPTLPELAANHAVHGVLLTTNFFGINTIPIALNEADYFRMWVQAATTMTIYQEVCDGLAAATPRTTAAPTILTPGAAVSPEPPSSQNPLQGLLDALEPILKSLGIHDGVTAHDPMISNALTTAVSDFLRNFGINWNPAAGTLNGQVYDYYSNAAQPIWYLARTLELFEDFLNVAQNPSQIIPALQYIAALALFDWPTHIAQLATTISQSPALIAAAAGAAVAPVGGLGGLAGLAGLAQQLPGVSTAPVVPVAPASVAAVPAAAIGPAVAAAPPPPAPPSAAAPAGAAPAASAAAPPAAAPSAVPLFPYLIGGGPGIDFGSGLGAHAAAADSVKKKAPTPEAVSAAAAAESRGAKRRRRRRTRPGHDDAVMDMTVEVSPEWEPTPVSDRGAGDLGRHGGVPADTSRAKGLTGLAGTELADGPRLPLLPQGWAAG